MEKSLFYNALPDAQSETGFDRNYNADDLSTFFSIIWENGVVKDGLKVETANDGLKVNVNVGYASIKGKGYYNDALKQFTLDTAPTGASARYDYIVLRYNKNIGVRSTNLYLITGTSTIPTVGTLTRSGDIYELMLAYIQVDPSVTTITQAKIIDERGDASLCPWFTAVKGYDDYYDAIVQTYESVVTMESAGTVVLTNIASTLYNDSYSLIDVYTNGIKEPITNYTVQTNGAYIQVTFTTQRAAGSKITIDLGNFIDGEGLSTAINSYNEWVNDVEQIKEKTEFTYVCNGVNDNVMITNIVNTFLALTDNYRSLNLSVVGNFGYTAMTGGNGTFSSPYVLFNFAETATDKKVNIDFSNCSLIDVNITNGTTNVFFKAYQLNITGLRINANNTASSTIIRAFNSDTIALECNKCYFWLTAYQDSYISRTGTFNDCYGKVYNTINYSWCFSMTGNGFLNIKGGEYRAYILDSSTYSAVVGQSGANSITIMYGVSAPTEAQGSYRQTHSIYHSAGQLGSTYLISELTVYSIDSSKIWASIAKSRGNIL